MLLLRKSGGQSGERYALPGGAQDPGETLQSALQRECDEEIGARVSVGDLVYVADYFKQRDTDPPSSRHLVEFLFACSVPAGYVPVNGHRPDKSQIDVVWMPLERLPQVELYPRSLAPYLISTEGERVYLGLLD